MPTQSLDDRFELLHNQAGSEGWLWARVGAKTLSKEANVALFDKDGKQLLETAIPCQDDAELRYFDFGNNRRFLAVSCLSSKQTQLYLFNGQALGEAVASDLPIDMAYDDERQALRIYRHLGKETACLLIDVRGTAQF